MLLSELKKIIMECIEELDEGWRRVDRLQKTNKWGSPSEEEAKKVDRDYKTAYDKLVRRNRRGIAKYGKENFIQLRYDGGKNRKQVKESGPADRYRRKTGDNRKDTTGDPLVNSSPYNRKAKWVIPNTDIPYSVKKPLEKAWKKRVPLSRGSHTKTFDRRISDPNETSGGVFGKRKYRGSFKKMVDKETKIKDGNK